MRSGSLCFSKMALCLCLVLVSSSAWSQPQVVKDQVLVEFQRVLGANGNVDFSKRVSGLYKAKRLIRDIALIYPNTLGANAPKRQTEAYDPAYYQAICEDLRRQYPIKICEPNFIVKTANTPNDAKYNQMWALPAMKAAQAWEYSTGSSDVVVAITDTGIDYTHPDLEANLWHNPGEIAGNGIDDDGNGYVDDIYGLNAITDSGSVYDDNGHGTHVAGTIGAVGNNSVGVAGVAWNVKLMALKFLDSGGAGSTADAITTIDYAIAKGAKVINASWGASMGSEPLTLKAAVERARDAGILFVAAAGNDGTDNDTAPHYPSSLNVSNVLAVAATDTDDSLANFSNYGVTSVDIGAPGVNILSTYPGGTYAYLSGTSMATPQVAGLAGLLLAANSTLSFSQLKNIIMSDGDSVSGLPILSPKRINALASIQDALGRTGDGDNSSPDLSVFSVIAGKYDLKSDNLNSSSVARKTYGIDISADGDTSDYSNTLLKLDLNGYECTLDAAFDLSLGYAFVYGRVASNVSGTVGVDIQTQEGASVGSTEFRVKGPRTKSKNKKKSKMRKVSRLSTSQASKTCKQFQKRYKGAF